MPLALSISIDSLILSIVCLTIYGFRICVLSFPLRENLSICVHVYTFIWESSICSFEILDSKNRMYDFVYTFHFFSPFKQLIFCLIEITIDGFLYVLKAINSHWFDKIAGKKRIFELLKSLILMFVFWTMI